MKNISETEMSLVGAIMLNEDRYQDVNCRVKATDFFSEAACHVYLVISKLYGKSQVNLQTVYKNVDARFRQWVIDASEQITSANAASLANIVSNEAKARRIKLGCDTISTHIKSGINVDSDDILKDIMALYRRELGATSKDHDILSVIDRFDRNVERNSMEGLGIKTGFIGLDKDYTYYRPGNLWIVGAWTSVGKSAWMIEAVNRIDRAKVAIFSTEMTEETNMARLLSNITGIGSNVILSGKALDKHKEQINDAKGEISTRDIHIFDDLYDMDEISMQCRKLKHGNGIDVIFVDFIQNLRKSGLKNKYEMMSQIAIDMQALAHELRCTIVCMSQLPNSAAKEDSGILEFKGAGEIAAAADVGVLMTRGKEEKKVILFDVRKNRHGPCGQIVFRFEDWVRLKEIEQ